MRKIFLTLFFGFPLLANANSNLVQSGVYEQIMIAVTPDNRIEGYYLENTGNEVAMSCSFYIEGNIKKNSIIPVSIISMEKHRGSLTFHNDGITLTVNDFGLAGCINSIGPEITQGVEYSISTQKKWIGLKTISVDKSYLFQKPEEISEHKIYVVKDDVVGVIEIKGKWTHIEYKSKNDKYYNGWIKNNQYIDIKNTHW